MKVIWFVSNYPHQANRIAGIFYQLLAEALVQEKIDLTIIAPTPFTGRILPMLKPRWRQYAEAPEEEIINNIQILRPRYFTPGNDTNSKRVHSNILRKALKLNLNKPDIVHGFGSYPIAMVALEFAAHFGVKSVITHIGSDVNDYPYRSERHLRVFRSICNHADRLLAVSSALCEKTTLLTSRACHTLYMPVKQIEINEHQISAARTHFGIDESLFTFLFVGKLAVEKGIAEILWMMEQLDGTTQVECLFAGQHSEWVSRINKTRRCRWIGELTHDEVLSLMHSVQLLLLPSYSEGLPGVIKEAGQCALPVIASAVGGVEELLSDETGFLIPAANREALLNEVKFVMNNYSLAKSKAKKLQTVVGRLFDSKTIAMQQIKHYEELLNLSAE